MFQGATEVNRDISSWNTAVVIDMSAMCRGASKFNVEVLDWVTAVVISISAMF